MLGNNVSLDDEGNVKLISNKMKQNRLGSAKKKKGGGGSDDDGRSGDSIVISPLLAEWATRGGGDDGGSGDAKMNDAQPRRGRREEDDAAVVGGARVDRERYEGRMDDLLDGIETTLSTTNFDVSKLVSDVACLARLGSGGAATGNKNNANDRVLLPTLKSLLSSSGVGQTASSSSYRLAWVGSDAAVCHVGTSLHKVPLARLQEVYLSLGGGGSVGVNKNKWELIEVIRILGPFPNVRNTLRGNVVGLTKAAVAGGGGANGVREVVRMEVSYTSMIDGTGKELLASSSSPPPSGGGRGRGNDNSGAKLVDLDVWFANDRAIVCTVPAPGDGDGGGGGEDPLGGVGPRVLYFVAEDDLEGALEKLRAA